MLQVMTLNINGHGTRHGPWQVRREIIVDLIREADPEVVALQAVERDPAPDGGLDQAAEIARLLPEYRYHAFEPAASGAGGKVEGQAFLARVPPLETGSCRLSGKEGEEDPTRRMVFHALFPFPGGPLRIASGHFSWIDAQNRRNLKEAAAFLAGFGEEALLLGDFNAPPGSAGLRELVRSGWTDLWALLSPGRSGFTFESNRPEKRIDYVWARGGLEERARSLTVVEGQERGGARASDHLGLLVSLDGPAARAAGR
jgi:endonuclease/exonuclease/phosphatase family metal-dependent hydrolase